MANAQRKKRNKTGIGLIMVLVVLICGVIMYKTAQVNAQLDKSRDEYERLESTYQAALDEESELEAERSYRQTDKYLEELARNNLGMVYPDEIVIVPSEDGK